MRETQAIRRAEIASRGVPPMTPFELALAALLAVSFGLSIVLMAVVTLVLEALMFAVGMRGRDWEARH